MFSKTMRYVFLLAGLLTVLTNFKTLVQKQNNKLIAMAKVQHKCDQVHIVSGGSDWKILDVCGTKRYYQYEVWCGDCSPTWREHKTSTK